MFTRVNPTEEKPRWRHYICDPCWRILEGARQPITLKQQYRVSAPCCYCGKTHESGIYYKADPETMICEGIHQT